MKIFISNAENSRLNDRDIDRKTKIVWTNGVSSHKIAYLLDASRCLVGKLQLDASIEMKLFTDEIVLCFILQTTNRALNLMG